MNDIQDIDWISQIHPINAAHLLDTQPHRVYGDAGGNLLEITVERFASTVVETLYGHGGIIAFRYHDATTDGEMSFDNAYVLKYDGRIHGLHSYYGELPIGMDIDLYYMLLNPVGINNWMVQDIGKLEEERKGFGKPGIGIDIPVGVMRLKLGEVIMNARDRYVRSLGR